MTMHNLLKDAEHLSTDVVVIGSGGAGLRAAIEAKTQGQRVLVLTKGKAGRTSCTAVSMGTFRVYQKAQDITHHFCETVQAGKFINNNVLVQHLVTNAWPAVKELETFGVTLLTEKGRCSIKSEKPAGILLSKALLNFALDLGVTIREDVTVLDLLVTHTCCGVVSLHKTGHLLIVSAKATIFGGVSPVRSCYPFVHLTRALTIPYGNRHSHKQIIVNSMSETWLTRVPSIPVMRVEHRSPATARPLFHGESGSSFLRRPLRILGGKGK